MKFHFHHGNRHHAILAKCYIAIASLHEIRPYLIADGGNVALREIDGSVVKVKLQGACGSCPSSVMTIKVGIERRLMEMIPEIVAVELIPDEETGLELNEENIETLLTKPH
ncbi:NifU-like protein 2 [Forsythia ovata]|uniref:NifU-like protein 2 n=1 Tax=Forsythia ovata TaxID=205694 RepID=A0ABD1S5V3_9LAMI